MVDVDIARVWFEDMVAARPHGSSDSHVAGAARWWAR